MNMNKLNIKDIPKGYPYPAIWRGKDKKGKWVFGFPVFTEAVGDETGQSIVQIECGVRGGSMIAVPGVWREIDPASLSQCTGEADIDGDLIFFDDRLLADHLHEGRVEVEIEMIGGCISVNSDYPSVCWPLENPKIIGTIHD